MPYRCLVYQRCSMDIWRKEERKEGMSSRSPCSLVRSWQDTALSRVHLPPPVLFQAPHTHKLCILRQARTPQEFYYLQIVKSCRSWPFWHCQKPPESGLLAEAASPAHPKMYSHLVSGERNPGNDSSAVVRGRPKILPLTYRSSPSLSPTLFETSMLRSRFTQGFQKRSNWPGSLIARASVP